jgi:hypothetical protein
VPLASAVFVIGVTPPIAYPTAFWVTLLAVAAVAIRERPDNQRATA